MRLASGYQNRSIWRLVMLWSSQKKEYQILSQIPVKNLQWSKVSQQTKLCFRLSTGKFQAGKATNVTTSHILRSYHSPCQIFSFNNLHIQTFNYRNRFREFVTMELVDLHSKHLHKHYHSPSVWQEQDNGLSTFEPIGHFEFRKYRQNWCPILLIVYPFQCCLFRFAYVINISS